MYRRQNKSVCKGNVKIDNTTYDSIPIVSYCGHQLLKVNLTLKTKHVFLRLRYSTFLKQVTTALHKRLVIYHIACSA